MAKRRTDEQPKAESLSTSHGPNNEKPSRTGILGVWERGDVWTKRIFIAIPVLIVIFIVGDSAVAVIFWLLIFGLFVGVAWYIVQRRGRGSTGESRDSRREPLQNERHREIVRQREDQTSEIDTDPVQQLARLSELHEAGALTQEEFDESKARLLMRL